MPPSTVRTTRGGSPPGLPGVDPWLVRVLGPLLGAYVVELVLFAAGVDVYALAWHPLGMGWAWWQVPGHLLIMPREAVLNVLISLLVAGMFLPGLRAHLGDRGLGELIGASVLGGIGAMLLFDAVGALGLMDVGRALALGWGHLIVALIVAFGLSNPTGEIRLYFLFPIPAWILVWGSLLVPALFLLVALGNGADVLGHARTVGAWGGAWAWWHSRGPAGRRRTLTARKTRIERELSHLQVLPGGKDDVVH
ncbi:MAG: hypothetical protein H6732_13925 [Alphaproteobacteria bacterium]|nr:hypothetical protein [Alphaproteobacteria bacterium]